MMKCEVCGCPVAVQGGEEGTNSYRCLCAAREAALVEALLAEQESSWHSGDCDDCTRLREDNTDWAAWPSCDEGLRLGHQAYELRRDALADTSPATPDGRTRAVALLAQGERIREALIRIRNMIATKRTSGRTADDWPIIAAECEEVARAALAPGETDVRD